MGLVVGHDARFTQWVCPSTLLPFMNMTLLLLWALGSVLDLDLGQDLDSRQGPGSAQVAPGPGATHNDMKLWTGPDWTF